MQSPFTPAAVALLCALLQGCGQTGPLQLPPPEEQTTPAGYAGSPRHSK
ncbi:LPS translocon maturation chaperone LptM [Kineobactrum salinum]|nr:lipoprotein [Kineobactrum salinum]